MTENPKIPFTKFHALGNDFIVIAGADVHGGRGGKRPADQALIRLARSICNRHLGVGADGLLIMLAPENREHVARMRVFNADGSEAEMSGNGIRCAAAFILTAGGWPKRLSEERLLQIETAAGVKSLRTVKQGRGMWVFRIGMGTPILEPEQIPLKTGSASAPIAGFPLHTSHGELRVTVTSMGNPHCSIFVSDFNTIDWLGLGREIEGSALFPHRTNVEFIKVISQTEIEVRFWERGVGQTTSSGTGACAAVVACVLNGLTSRKVRVDTAGGMLEVDWPRNGEVTLTGRVQLVAHGTYHYRG